MKQGIAAAFVGLTFLAALAAGSARAQDADGGYTFEFTPFIWAPGMSGDMTIRGRTSSVDASFIDVVEESDSIIGAMAQIEIGKGRWTAFLSPTYMSVAAAETTSIGPLTLRADVETKLFYFEFGAAYKVLSWGNGAARGGTGGGAVDLLAGGRYTDLEAKIGIEGALPIGFAGARSVKENKEWVEPFIGARTRIRLADRWLMQLRGDVGGFGVGSDLALQGVAMVGYEFAMFGRDAIVFGGYRALYQDYVEGAGAQAFAWDMTLHGPVLGLNVRF
jgi:hypothetical protein